MQKQSLLCLFFALSLWALPSQGQQSPGVADWVKAEQEPKPLNLPDIRKAIGYPQIARDAGIEGNVVCRILVGERGEYLKHVVLNPVHPVLTNSVEQYLPQLKFSPAIVEGAPAKFWVNLPFTFKLLTATSASAPALPAAKTAPSPQNLAALIEKIGYPSSAFQSGKEGTVVVGILVSPEGAYLRHEVLNEADPVFIEAVEAHLHELKFDPVRLDGAPAKAWVNLPFTFRLPGKGAQTLDQTLLTLFPNPGEGGLRYELRSAQALKNAHLLIRDMQGKTMLKQAIQDSQGFVSGQVKTESLPAGTYLVIIQTDHGSVSERWIKD